ncbi:hexosyltransferase, partial [Trypanosoma cruzi]
HNTAWDVSKCCIFRRGGARVAEVVGLRRPIIGSGVEPEGQNSRGHNEGNQQHSSPLQLLSERQQFRFRHGRCWCERLSNRKKGAERVWERQAKIRNATATRRHAATQVRGGPPANLPRHPDPGRCG